MATKKTLISERPKSYVNGCIALFLTVYYFKHGTNDKYIKVT